MRIFLTLFFVLFFQAAPAYPENAIALHGAPKYTDTSKAFDYVNPNAPKGGELRLAIIGSFDQMTPYPVKSSSAEGMFLAFDSLLKRSLDEPFSCYGRIASGVNLNPSESEVTFTIDPRARFHNKAAITAKDVLATFKIVKEKGPFTLRQAFTKVTQAEIIDQHNIKFTFVQPGQRQLALMLGFMPILSHKDIESTKVETLQQLNAVGNGPYKIAKSQPGKFIEYERVPDYWAKDLNINKGQYNFNSIKFEYFRNYETAFQAFKAGEIDVFQEEDIGNWLKNYNFAATQRGDVQLKEIPHPSTGMTGFVFNTRKPFLSHLLVRKALSLSLDLAWLNKTYFHNAYEPITSYFQHTPFEASLTQPTADDARTSRHQALELLKQAGFVIQKQQLIDPATKLPITLEILIQPGPHERIALAYQKSLESLGLKVHLRTVDPVQYESRLSKYDFDIIFHGWEQTLAPSEEQLKYWGSLAANTPGTRNYAGVNSPEIDGILHKIILERDTQKLIPLLQSLDRQLRMGYYVAPFLMKQRDMIAYWHKFGQPKVQPVSTFPLVKWWVTQTWWQH